MEQEKSVKEIEQMKRKSDGSNIYPITITEAVIDKESDIQLSDMLKAFNCIYLPQLTFPNVTDNLFATRCLIPHKFRRPMMFVTRLDSNNKLVLEYFTSDCIEDHTWGDSRYWQALIDGDGNATIVQKETIQGDTLSFDKQINQLWINKHNGDKEDAGQPLTYFKMVQQEGKNYFTLYGTKDPESSSWEDSKWISEGEFLGQVTNLLKVWKYFNTMDDAIGEIQDIPDSGLIAIKNGENWDLYAKNNNEYIRLGGVSVSAAQTITTSQFNDNKDNDELAPTCKAVVDYFNSFFGRNVVDVEAIGMILLLGDRDIYDQMTDKGIKSSGIFASPFNSGRTLSFGSTNFNNAVTMSNNKGYGVVIRSDGDYNIQENRVLRLESPTSGGVSNSLDPLSGRYKHNVSRRISFSYTEGNYNSMYTSDAFTVKLIPSEMFEEGFFNDQEGYRGAIAVVKVINNNECFYVKKCKITGMSDIDVEVPKLFLGKNNVNLLNTFNVDVSIYLMIDKTQYLKDYFNFGNNELPRFFRISSALGTNKIKILCHDKGTTITADSVTTPEINTNRINGKDVSEIGGFSLKQLQSELSNKERFICGINGADKNTKVNVKNLIQIIPYTEYVLYKGIINTDSYSLDCTDIIDLSYNPERNPEDTEISIRSNLFFRKSFSTTTAGVNIKKLTFNIYDEAFYPVADGSDELSSIKRFSPSDYKITVEIDGNIKEAAQHNYTHSCSYSYDFSNPPILNVTIKAIFLNIKSSN